MGLEIQGGGGKEERGKKKLGLVFFTGKGRGCPSDKTEKVFNTGKRLKPALL